jgi:hypothetical protein
VAKLLSCVIWWEVWNGVIYAPYLCAGYVSFYFVELILYVFDEDKLSRLRSSAQWGLELLSVPGVRFIGRKFA